MPLCDDNFIMLKSISWYVITSTVAQIIPHTKQEMSDTSYMVYVVYANGRQYAFFIETKPQKRIMFRRKKIKFKIETTVATQ